MSLVAGFDSTARLHAGRLGLPLAGTNRKHLKALPCCLEEGFCFEACLLCCDGACCGCAHVSIRCYSSCDERINATAMPSPTRL